MPEIPSHRICSKCKELKPADAFRIDKRFGILEARCRACGNLYSQRYQKTDKGRLSSVRSQQKYAKAHPDRIQATRDAIKARPFNPADLPSERQCTNCKEVKPAAEFYVDTRWHCLTSQCRKCKEEYYKQYKQTEHAKQLAIKHAKAHYNRPENRSKIQARDTIHQATRHKKLTKPSSCSQCGNTQKRIEAHHYLGYAKENRFDIIWLCSTCHKKAEKQLSEKQLLT